MKNFLVVLLSLTSLCGFAEAKHRGSSAPSSLAPTHVSLLRQNLCADQMGLVRIQNETELQSLVNSGTLIALPNDDVVQTAPSLPENRRYALPLTVSFLHTLAEAYRDRFSTFLVVDSAVRDADTQRRLRRINHSAAPVYGETASVHETGAAIDLSKRLTGAQLRWLRNMLSYYQTMNVAVVEEERRCFHIVVIGETE
jgi:hypothetical protein